MPEGHFRNLAEQVSAKRERLRKQEELLAISTAALRLADRAASFHWMDLAALLTDAATKAQEKSRALGE